MKHPQEQGTLRVRRRSERCELERTARHERELDAELEKTYAYLAQEAMADLDELLERESPAEPLAPEPRRRWGWLRTLGAWVAAFAIAALLLWVVIETADSCSRCDGQPRYERSE